MRASGLALDSRCAFAPLAENTAGLFLGEGLKSICILIKMQRVTVSV